MCGIGGLVVPSGSSVPLETLEAMGVALRHRGPDDGTVRSYGRAGFAFRRLSIIDVAGGAQPLDDESGRRHLVLNGEIYNHLELRRELEAKGHRFKTRSDAEAVIHGYEEWDVDVVRRLRGMFAFAIWDETLERLLLARDRLGEKPLVYHQARGRLAFASELQALLRDPEVPREPDRTAIHHYLTYQYVPAPFSAYAGVSKLPAGHRLVWERGETRVERYWNASCRPEIRISEEDAAAELRRLVRDAVRVRLMSEVPLGAFLSGGLDSTTTVAMMAESGSVKTFSVGFEDDDFDELDYAREAARRFGTEHHEMVVRADVAAVLPRIVEHYGEPFADSSALPTFFLSRATAQHVKVTLTGDGGDELFAGYTRYRALALYELLARLPAARGLGLRLAGLLDGRIPVRASRLLRAIASRPEESYARTVSYLQPEEKRSLYAEPMLETSRLDSFQLLYDRYAASDGLTLLARTLDVDTHTYLPDDLLVKVDIASMAHGLEARAPFLDHPLVEFAARLPARLKLRRGTSKWLLRRAFGDLLPAKILHRGKMGFAVPLARWLRGDLRELLRDSLLTRSPLAGTVFRPEPVARLVDEHLSGRRDHALKLWALMMLVMWSRRFLENRD